MEEIINEVMDKMLTLKKPQRKFMLQLFSVFSMFIGKANFRNLSRYCQLHEKTIARWFTKSFEYLRFNKILIFIGIDGSAEKIAAIDASFINKSGKKTYGLGKFWNGKNSRAEKGLEISLLSIVDMGSNTAYALEARQTIDPLNGTRLDLYTKQVQGVAPQLHELGVSYLAVDSHYAKTKFIDGVCDTGLHLVGKLRCDANLLFPYTGQYSGKGRPRKFDGKLDINQNLSRLDHVCRLEDGIEMYTGILHSRHFRRDLKVVILRWNKDGKVGHAVLYTTDTSLTAQKILDYYKARFQIEFVFRDAKQYTGLTDFQCRHKDAIHNHINVAFAALNLLKIEDQRQSKPNQPNVISIASWKRRKFNQHYMKLLFYNLGLDMNTKKVNDVFERFSNYGEIAA
jgi:hypothetical protein